MREIKFRAWDKESNWWYEPIYEAHAGELEELLIGLNGHLNMRTLQGLYHQSGFPDRFVLMQYTGLKDKNGTEIYEGDVIGFPRLSQERQVRNVIVIFANGCFMVNQSPFPNDNFPFLPLPLIEILGMYAGVQIGNICENPELPGVS